MKNSQDDFYVEHSSTEKKTIETSKETVNNDISYDQDRREGISKNEESTGEIRETFEEKGENPAQEAETASREDTGDSEEILVSEDDAPTDNTDPIKAESSNYSCSYKPPYYVPDFTVVNAAKGDRRKGGAKIWLIALAALVVSLAIFSIVFIGMQLMRNSQDRTEGNGVANSGSGENVTVSRNDSPIQVTVDQDSSSVQALTIEQVVDLVADTVVEIVTTHVQTGQFGYGQYVTGGAGSGVLIDKEGRGYIITNQHVIGNDPDQTTITVRLSDGREFEARYIAGDAQADIAVLKIDATGLPYATMGSSGALRVGQGVVAIGNPLGELGGTVTNGIISALDRQVIVDGNRMTLLQTNAEINPGNSGGGLFDMAGRLIGIVNAKQSATGIEGLGFAIPIDVAWDVASDLIQYGYVVDQLVLPFEAEYHDDLTYHYFGTRTMPAGVYIMESEHAELKQYDRIVSINGKTINTIGEYYSAIDSIRAGETVILVISRLGTNYQLREYTVTITAKFTTAPNT